MREKPRRLSEVLEPYPLHRQSYHVWLTFNQTVTKCLNACLPALYSKSQPCDSLSVGANHFRERGGVPNKLSGECISTLSKIVFTVKKKAMAFCKSFSYRETQGYVLGVNAIAGYNTQKQFHCKSKMKAWIQSDHPFSAPFKRHSSCGCTWYVGSFGN